MLYCVHANQEQGNEADDQRTEGIELLFSVRADQQPRFVELPVSRELELEDIRKLLHSIVKHSSKYR